MIISKFIQFIHSYNQLLKMKNTIILASAFATADASLLDTFHGRLESTKQLATDVVQDFLYDMSVNYGLDETVNESVDQARELIKDYKVE